MDRKCAPQAAGVMGNCAPQAPEIKKTGAAGSGKSKIGAAGPGNIKIGAVGGLQNEGAKWTHVRGWGYLLQN